MYEKVEIPAQTIESCISCSHFKNRTIYWDSADPETVDYCGNPSIEQPDQKTKHTHSSNLEEIKLGYVVTPEWCPFKKSMV